MVVLEQEWSFGVFFEAKDKAVKGRFEGWKRVLWAREVKREVEKGVDINAGEVIWIVDLERSWVEGEGAFDGEFEILRDEFWKWFPRDVCY